jgi:hypothetical protein
MMSVVLAECHFCLVLRPFKLSVVMLSVVAPKPTSLFSPNVSEEQKCPITLTLSLHLPS